MTKNEFLGKLDGLDGVIGLEEEGSLITVKLKTVATLTFDTESNDMNVNMVPYTSTHIVDDLDYFIEKHQTHLRSKGVK